MPARARGRNVRPRRASSLPDPARRPRPLQRHRPAGRRSGQALPVPCAAGRARRRQRRLHADAPADSRGDRSADERYWLYMEDLDLCYRAAQAGWVTWYEPSVVVTHLKGGSSGRNRRLRANYAFHYGMCLFYRQHYAAGRPARAQRDDLRRHRGQAHRFLGSQHLQPARARAEGEAGTRTSHVTRSTTDLRAHSKERIGQAAFAATEDVLRVWRGELRKARARDVPQSEVRSRARSSTAAQSRAGRKLQRNDRPASAAPPDHDPTRRARHDRPFEPARPSAPRVFSPARRRECPRSDAWFGQRDRRSSRSCGAAVLSPGALRSASR